MKNEEKDIKEKQKQLEGDVVEVNESDDDDEEEEEVTSTRKVVIVAGT